MKAADNPSSTREEDTITLPVTALKTLGVPLDAQITGGCGITENGSSFMAAAGRQPFPCFKKSFSNEQLVIRIVQEHLARA